MCPRRSSYDAIVDAAEAVVIESGASHMTLDAVAMRAGVSKGGLLHHFPTKVALLEAMLERQIKRREELQDRACRGLPDSPARALKGHVLSVLLRDKNADRIGAPILATLAHNPKLVKPLREVIKKRYAGYASPGTKFEKAAIIALAADALLLQEILSLSPFSDKERKNIIDELLRLADEGME